MSRSKVQPLTFEVPALKKDGTDFRSFYQAHHQAVRSVLCRTGLKNDIEDAVQDTFIKAWESMEQFQDRANVRTWLIRIAINTAIDRLRAMPQHLLSLNAAAGKASELRPIEHFENSQLVEQALAMLSVDHRMVVVLQAMEGYSLREISEILKLPEGTVKSRLHLAKKQLQSFLESLGVGL